MPAKPTSTFDAWCSQHQKHPSECWEEHNKAAVEKAKTTPTLDEQATRDQVAKIHREAQIVNSLISMGRVV